MLDQGMEIISYNRDLIVWNNREILIDGNSIFLRKLYSRGFIFI